MKHAKAGFGLVELMIALLLGSFVTAGISQLFLQSNQALRKTRTLSYLMEDGRYAMELFGQEFRRMGYLNNPVQEYKSAAADKSFIADSNVLASGINLGAGASGAFSEAIHGSYAASGFSSNSHDINHIVFRYQVADAQDKGNSPCSNGFTPDLSAGAVKTIYIYVATDNTTGAQTLYCKAKGGGQTPNAVPLISNIEKLFVFYGIDTDNDEYANQYVTATGVTNWTRVVSVRLTLVLMSEDANVASKTPSYTVDGTTTTLRGDTHIYRAFTTTLTTRNFYVVN